MVPSVERPIGYVKKPNAKKKTMKRRWLWVIAWFAALILWNVGSHWSQNADKNRILEMQLITPEAAMTPTETEEHPIIASVLESIGNVTSPVELFLSAIVISGVLFSKRKPMAER